MALKHKISLLRFTLALRANDIHNEWNALEKNRTEKLDNGFERMYTCMIQADKNQMCVHCTV